MKKTMDFQRGFTLIEMMIVMALIAVLSTSFYLNISNSSLRARDSKRKTDLSEIQKALEIYKLDQNPQSYPTTGALPTTMCNQCFSQKSGCSGNVYAGKIPCDPQTKAPYIYTQNPSDSLRYTITACLENSSDNNKDETTVSQCADISRVSYTIREP